MTSCSWFALHGLEEENIHFCVCYWFALDHILNFSMSDLHLTQTFCFLGLCWDTVNMPVSLPSDKLAAIQQLTFSLIQIHHAIVCKVMSFNRQG